MSSDCSGYQIPILLGVTGHRNVARSQYPKIKELLSEFIEEHVVRKYPHSPVKLLTPLADGADRLVAEIALGQGIPIIVPLPMPQEVYASTFAGEAGSPERDGSVAEFERLLAAAESSFLLPLVEGVSEQGLLRSEEERGSQYALVGAYMAKHCHILIALYDGKSSEAIGGTSQIVNYRMNGEMKGLPLKIASEIAEERFDFLNIDNIFDQQNTGIVWRVQVQREPGGGESSEVRICQEASADPEAEASGSAPLAGFVEALQKIDAFNRDVSDYQDTLDPRGELFEKPREELLRQQQALLDADASGSGSLKRTRDVFQAADQLSMLFNRDHKAYFTVFCSVVVGLAVVELLYAHEWHPVAAMGAYFLLLLFGLGAYQMHKRQMSHSKYNEYRSLAEALRVQFFWRSAGLRSIVSDHYLKKHQKETLWISSAIKALAFNSYLETPHNVEFVIEAWIKDQANFYQDRLSRLKEAEKYGEFYGYALYWLVFALSLAGVFFHEYIDHAAVSFTLGLIPVVYFILEHKQDFNAELEKRQSYKIYHKLFKRALSKIERDKGQDRFENTPCRRLIYQLGCEALIENGDWLIVNRDKKVEAAKP